MIACVGQQNVEGKRIPFGFHGRTLPHFTKVPGFRSQDLPFQPASEPCTTGHNTSGISRPTRHPSRRNLLFPHFFSILCVLGLSEDVLHAVYQAMPVLGLVCISPRPQTPICLRSGACLGVLCMMALISQKALETCQLCMSVHRHAVSLQKDPCQLLGSGLHGAQVTGQPGQPFPA